MGLGALGIGLGDYGIKNQRQIRAHETMEINLHKQVKKKFILKMFKYK